MIMLSGRGEDTGYGGGGGGGGERSAQPAGQAADRGGSQGGYTPDSSLDPIGEDDDLPF